MYDSTHRLLNRESTVHSRTLFVPDDIETSPCCIVTARRALLYDVYCVLLGARHPRVECALHHNYITITSPLHYHYITVTLPLHYRYITVTSRCPAVYHPMLRCLPPRCLPPHAPLSATPCPAVYHPMLRCLSPHAPLSTTP